MCRRRVMSLMTGGTLHRFPFLRRVTLLTVTTGEVLEGKVVARLLQEIDCRNWLKMHYQNRNVALGSVGVACCKADWQLVEKSWVIEKAH